MWRVKFTLAKIRKAARELLTLDEKDSKRLFEGKHVEQTTCFYLSADDLNINCQTLLWCHEFLVNEASSHLCLEQMWWQYISSVCGFQVMPCSDVW